MNIFLIEIVLFHNKSYLLSMSVLGYFIFNRNNLISFYLTMGKLYFTQKNETNIHDLYMRQILNRKISCHKLITTFLV